MGKFAYNRVASSPYAQADAMARQSSLFPLYRLYRLYQTLCHEKRNTRAAGRPLDRGLRRAGEAG